MPSRACAAQYASWRQWIQAVRAALRLARGLTGGAWPTITAAALFLVASAARADVPSLYLVQTSGWMEPFFADRASPFKPLLRSLVNASQTGRTIVAEFNQDGQVPGRRSPEVAYDGPYAAAPVHAAIDALSLAVRPGGRLADADFGEALARSLDAVLGGKPGILWVITNNKNSRNNSPEINRNTRDFAELVRSSPYLPFAAAYPVRMPVTGRQYSERGLIIYAIAYGDEAAADLRRVVDGAPMRALFTDPPFRLKHLDQAPLTFTATDTGTGTEAGRASSLPGGGILIAGVVPDGTGTVRVTGALRSDYYPQTIISADVSLTWAALDGVADPAALPAQVEPRTLSRLAPGTQQGSVTLTLHTPAVARPPGLSGLWARSRMLNGTLQLRLASLSMALGDDFAAKMGEIAALDQLPDVFADYQRVTGATAAIPVTLVIQFSAWPLALALVLSALLAASLLAGMAVAARARRYAVPFEGGRRTFTLRPLQTQVVRLPGNRSLVVTGRLFGPPRSRIVDAPRAPGR